LPTPPGPPTQNVNRQVKFKIIFRRVTWDEWFLDEVGFVCGQISRHRHAAYLEKLRADSEQPASEVEEKAHELLWESLMTLRAPNEVGGGPVTNGARYVSKPHSSNNAFPALRLIPTQQLGSVVSFTEILDQGWTTLGLIRRVDSKIWLSGARSGAGE